jgi:peptidoglycan/LPS O-acetylase OafA/YrhL
MNKQFSRYLDLLRVIAAFLVLFAHLSDPTITEGEITAPNQIGYSAVMIFFVLSGYVISYVATERECTLFDFAISRIARVYSVVIPALLLTVFIDFLFIHVKPPFNTAKLMAGIPLYQYAKFPRYFVMNLLFLNNIWGFKAPEFSNDVYWSMCFEVYYYVIFAFAFYFNGWRRLFMVILAISAIGPGPMLHFQLWLFGYIVYQLHRYCEMPVVTARLAFALSGALIAIDLATDLNLRIDAQLDLLTNGWVSAGLLRRVAGDTLTGLLVAVNIFAARYAAWDFGPVGKWFTDLASFTFALYLMHGPLLRLWAGYWHPKPFMIVVMVLVSVWLLGQITERQKDRLRAMLRQKLAPIFVSSVRLAPSVEE